MHKTILILSLAVATFAQDLTTEADAFMQQQKQFSGTVLIAKEGKDVFEKAYGMANYE